MPSGFGWFADGLAVPSLEIPQSHCIIRLCARKVVDVVVQIVTTDNIG